MLSSSFLGTQIPPLQALTKSCGIEKSGPGATSVSSALAEGPHIVKCWHKKAASLGLSLWPDSWNIWVKMGRLVLQSLQGMLDTYVAENPK